ncbi:hypothetical protein AB0C27_30200 [Nonomuraea sp. NPDC048882]|uniref:hypothetical protein n=1 Tax=Nonomuraea sp. NPDC048882 TaxID=3154347 RepID=UPI0033D5864F
MNVDAEAGRDGLDGAVRRVPWAGVVVTVVSLIAMVAIAWALWDSLPELVTTQEARGRRGRIQVPRIVLAAALPAAVVALAVIMALASVVAGRLRAWLPPALVSSPRAQAASTNAVFVLLPPFITVLHTGLLLETAGHHVPLPQVVTAAFGLVIAGLGGVLPRLRPTRPDPAGDRVRRAGAVAMMLLGAGCVAGAFLLPALPVAVAAAYAGGGIAGLTILLARLWPRHR